MFAANWSRLTTLLYSMGAQTIITLDRMFKLLRKISCPRKLRRNSKLTFSGFREFARARYFYNPAAVLLGQGNFGTTHTITSGIVATLITQS